jgi:hypothetical protein
MIGRNGPLKSLCCPTILLFPCKSERGHGIVDEDDNGEAIPSSLTSVASTSADRIWNAERHLTVSLSMLIHNFLSDCMHLAVPGETRYPLHIHPTIDRICFKSPDNIMMPQLDVKDGDVGCLGDQWCLLLIYKGIDRSTLYPLWPNPQ